jgi:hypothetical protein
MTTKAQEKPETAYRIEILDTTLELSPGGQTIMVYEIDGSAKRWLFTLETSMSLSDRKRAAELFLLGRERGQVEGRNELRLRLGDMLSTMESV